MGEKEKKQRRAISMTIGKIPVVISPLFFVTVVVVAAFYGRDLWSVCTWGFTIALSILLHELGHAGGALAFGRKPRVSLMPFGGVTDPGRYSARKIREKKREPWLRISTLWEEFFIVITGPLVNFFLCALSIFITPYLSLAPLPLISFLGVFQRVNLFLGLVNCLPMLPLDGGQVLRIVLEGFLGMRAWKYVLLSSVMVGGFCALLCFLSGFLVVGSLFTLFAWQNGITWRRVDLFSEADRDERIKEWMIRADMSLSQGRRGEAKTILRRVIARAKRGVIFQLASQQLASIEFEEEHFDKAYHLLRSIQKRLSLEGQKMLYLSAYRMEDYTLVETLAGSLFQRLPTKEIALVAARASGYRENIEGAVGWLKMAFRLSTISSDRVSEIGPKVGVELDKVLQEEPFVLLKNCSHREKFNQEITLIKEELGL